MNRNQEFKTLTKILFHKSGSLLPQYWKPLSKWGYYSPEARVKVGCDPEGIHGMLSTYVPHLRPTNHRQEGCLDKLFFEIKYKQN